MGALSESSIHALLSAIKILAAFSHCAALEISGQLNLFSELDMFLGLSTGSFWALNGILSLWTE